MICQTCPILMSVETPVFSRVRVTVLDSAGVGMAQNRLAQYPWDADTIKLDKPHDPIPVNSISNASQIKPINAPVLLSLGLDRLPGLENMKTVQEKGSIEVKGAYGVLTPTFEGNGSPEGHQALMGHIVDKPYELFNTETGFPDDIVDLVRNTVKKVVGREVEIIRNTGEKKDDISGTTFINLPEIGDAHVASKDKNILKVPIYASSDSLIQIALHQRVIPQEQILEIGQAVRDAVNQTDHRIARIIMRPFINNPKYDPNREINDQNPRYIRVEEDRKDFGVDPDGLTLIDYLEEAGIPVGGVGKAPSMVNYQGFGDEETVHKRVHKLGTDKERMEHIVAYFADHRDLSPQVNFDNIISLDEKYGHRREPENYIDHLNMLAAYIAQAMMFMAEDDLWILTADHGNDPTQKKHTNHTNEMVPLFVYSPKMKRAVNLGVRSTYVDVAATVAENFGIGDKITNGTSFLRELVEATSKAINN